MLGVRTLGFRDSGADHLPGGGSVPRFGADRFVKTVICRVASETDVYAEASQEFVPDLDVFYDCGAFVFYPVSEIGCLRVRHGCVALTLRQAFEKGFHRGEVEFEGECRMARFMR